jgi:GNAT superfamily N-acetyltransferase
VDVRVAPIAVADARVLRQRILRPHQTVDELVFERDDADDSLHVGAFVTGRLAAIASVMRDEGTDAPGSRAWRVRGMATVEDLRGRGLGRAVLERCLEHADAQGAAIVWCNARTGAVGFYERLGFEVASEPFDVPAIGPHVRMIRRLG